MTLKKVIQRVIVGRHQRGKVQKLYEECSESMNLLESLKRLNAAGLDESKDSEEIMRRIVRQRFTAELQCGLDQHLAAGDETPVNAPES